MQNQVTVQQIVDLLNRDAERLTENTSVYDHVIQRERKAAKVVQCHMMLGRITAHNNGIRSITKSGD